MASELKIKQSDSIFESIKHEDKQGDFGMLGSLAKLLNTGRGMVSFQ